MAAPPLAADYDRRVRLRHDNGIQINGSFVLGFDHDHRDVFAKTADWVEKNRLECATRLSDLEEDRLLRAL